ncbi:hypothetical protein, partial [Bifidobacterium bifidum]|uniref:hypothetical protein n=1 Tax=Bifidobacterium bifidum TaxID=1681 RepID=UPI001EFA19D1
MSNMTGVPVPAFGARPESEPAPVVAVPCVEKRVPVVQSGFVVEHVAGVSPEGDDVVASHGFAYGVVHAFARHLPCVAAFAGRALPQAQRLGEPVGDAACDERGGVVGQGAVEEHGDGLAVPEFEFGVFVGVPFLAGHVRVLGGLAL